MIHLIRRFDIQPVPHLPLRSQGADLSIFGLCTVGKISIGYTADLSSFPTYKEWRDLSFSSQVHLNYETQNLDKKSHCIIFK